MGKFTNLKKTLLNYEEKINYFILKKYYLITHTKDYDELSMPKCAEVKIEPASNLEYSEMKI